MLPPGGEPSAGTRERATQRRSDAKGTGLQRESGFMLSRKPLEDLKRGNGRV